MKQEISASHPFRLRLNCIDHYQCPSSSLDPNIYPIANESQLAWNFQQAVPIIRIFGSTNTGQKVCAHVHGAFPYVYLPYDESLDPQEVGIYIKALTTSINQSLALSYRRDTTKTGTSSFVAFISLIKGVPFYGYTVGYKPFLKVYLRNPAHMTRFADILSQEIILGRSFQPAESHMQYVPQWMCDYNLYGCAFMECENVFFRSPVPDEGETSFWNETNIPEENILDPIEFQRQSHCDIEIDVQVHHILNREQIIPREIHHSFDERFFRPKPDFKFVPSMAGLWRDEVVRRKKKLGLQDSDQTPFPPEALVTMSGNLRTDRGNWVHEEEYFEAVKEIIENEKSIVPRDRMNFDTYLSKNPDIGAIQTASDSVQEFYPKNIENTLANESYSTQDLAQFGDGGILDEDNLVDLENVYDDHTADSSNERNNDIIVQNHSQNISNTLSKRKRSPSMNSQIDKSLPGTQTSIDNILKVSKSATGNFKEVSEDSHSLPSSLDFLSNSQYKELINKVPAITKPVELNSKTWTMATAGIYDRFPSMSKTFIFKNHPPDPTKCLGTMAKHAVPLCIHQDAFYSDEMDIPKHVQDTLNKDAKLRGISIPYLPDFDKSGRSKAAFGIDSSNPVNMIKLDYQYAEKRSNCTYRHWRIAIPPPPPKIVCKWLENNRLERKSAIITNAKKRKHFSQIDCSTIKPHTNNGSGNSVKTSVSHETQYMTMMSVEVHVNTRKDLVPDPVEDQIGCIVWTIKTETDNHEFPTFMNGIIILVTDDIEEGQFDKWKDVHVSYEKDELELLNRFVSILQEIDPDILIGYEIHNGSWGYLIERTRIKYEFDLCLELSRIKYHSTSLAGKTANHYDVTTTSAIRVTGRHIINVWRAIQGEANYLQYTLENVVFQTLGKRLPHYSFEQLTSWYTSRNQHSIGRVVEYFLSRAQLNIRVLDKFDVVARTSEQARLLGVDFFSVISRGSQFKVESLMFRIAKPENYIIPSPSRKQVGSQNALECLPLVMEPQSNFYPSPVLVLDFQSLYPSIMIAYNYCYSTCLGRVISWRGINKLGFTDCDRPPGVLELLQDNINIAPNGLIYVQPSIRRGLLAKMLTEILETRVMVKSGMKQDKDDAPLQRLLQNRQLALKLIANVTYGYASASFSGRMPCAEIADSIVQTAREILEKSIAVIHAESKWNAEVVYGDTDSLFIHLKNRTREEAFKIGKDIAETITKAHPSPIKLKFEKVYQPCVLLAKKRYVGFKYESPDQAEPEFDAKGIETVRRDGTPAEQKIEEKVLKIFFRTHDLSQVKRYFQAQCAKILRGSVSVQDFQFAREVRLGSYSTTATVAPAGAMIATKRMKRDPRNEPQYGERVPYVVIAGAPGARLIDRCVDPGVVLRGEAELDAEYYIGKNIVPPLERILGLVGVSVRSWWAEVPKVMRLRGDEGRRKNTLETYMRERGCFVCGSARDEDGMVQRRRATTGQDVLVCRACCDDGSAALYNLQAAVWKVEQRLEAMHQVCRSCSGLAFSDPVVCDSRDCPVFYSRVRYQSKLARLRDRAKIVIEYEEDV